MTNAERIKKYYDELDRSYFLTEHKEHARVDAPLPIGYGQTISQPSLVLRMTILLDVRKESRVLELGTGSGFQTALLSKTSKKVYTVERISELLKSAKERLEKAGYSNIEFKLDDGEIGWREHAPYDRIMVTAAADKLPEALIEQLDKNGKMIIPVGASDVQDLLLIEKDSNGNITKKLIDKVRFVRLVRDY